MKQRGDRFFGLHTDTEAIQPSRALKVTLMSSTQHSFSHPNTHIPQSLELSQTVQKVRCRWSASNSLQLAEKLGVALMSDTCSLIPLTHVQRHASPSRSKFTNLSMTSFTRRRINQWQWSPFKKTMCARSSLKTSRNNFPNCVLDVCVNPMETLCSCLHGNTSVHKQVFWISLQRHGLGDMGGHGWVTSLPVCTFQTCESWTVNVSFHLN